MVKRLTWLIPCCLVLAGCTPAFDTGQSGNLEAVNLVLPDGLTTEAIAELYPLDPDKEETIEIGPGVIGTQVGNDYECILYNRAWFLVNNRPLPTVAELKAELLFVPSGAVGDWPEGTGDGDSPFRVGSALFPFLTANNLGTESQWQVLDPSGCVQIPVAVASSAPESFVEFLKSAAGQGALAETGLAYPVTGTVPANVAKLAPEPADAQPQS